MAVRRTEWFHDDRDGSVMAWTLILANGNAYRFNRYRDPRYGVRVIVFDLQTGDRLHTWHRLANGQRCTAGGMHGQCGRR